MLISICIPHYNRSKYLLLVLDSIKIQDYPNIEVIVSDDCSTDDSLTVIPQYIAKQEGKCLIRYIRQERNLGYDGNLRASLSAAHGDYLFILGNDDALPQADTISQLVGILKRLHSPDIAFANFHLYGREEQVIRRALNTVLIGSGPDVAVKTFRSFSFFGGIVIKRTAFREHDTSAYDGSIYFQIYLAARIVSSGGSLASISESLVAKDVQFQGETANTYLDVLVRDNQKQTPKTGGLDQVGRVACDAILPYIPTAKRGKYILSIYRQLFFYSYPYWLYDYRKNGVFRAAVNLALGCFPGNLIRIKEVPLSVHVYLLIVYIAITSAGLLVPIRFLEKIKGTVYRLSKSV
ncbi:MAG: glycosyltransferase family 2 protein [Nitrospirae bacterium]|nr:glycosyltransferase family 2 protein [Nitrospirota bacterium]